MKLEDLKYINPGPEKILYYKELSEYIIPFIGKDGKEYATLEALQRANRKFDERMLRVDKLPFYTIPPYITPSYIGDDGNYYDNYEALEKANREFSERMNREIKYKFI